MTAPFILVLDDETLVGFEIATILEGGGFHIMGPFRTGEQALVALEQQTPMAAVLDVNLGYGRTSIAVAEALRERQCPFLFLTGYAGIDAMMDDRFIDEVRLRKPCAPNKLIAALRQLLPVMPDA